MVINSLKLVVTGSAEKHLGVGYGGQRLDTSPSQRRRRRQQPRVIFEKEISLNKMSPPDHI